MSRSIAINVGANTNQPGVRGPIYADGRFEYVPIPEEEPTSESVPTYADLDLAVDLPDGAANLPVHLDPEFAEYPTCDRYTYGDDHGVKAGPLSKLDPGDSLFFYATLTFHGDEAGAADWVTPDWGTYLIGEFRVVRAVTGDEYDALAPDEQAVFANNAHVKRDPFDAKVLVEGGEDSRLFDHAVPLSTAEAGVDANRLVTELSNDSGKGPWWRRRLWFDEGATSELRALVDAWPEGDVSAP
ncbi:hypothetical protein SAMN04487949_3079 [Halogranum gelatinilyticum]|uniref:Nucleotide modification associated domain-containing protein n=1 Tax=Halogranum gelatinilyticum TaxID=660521 RepID=A0A1G9XRH9_9EURY|nr:hypothetical protein [Halogranum gelatinilyticum]SDM98775.1 hypothetical protein SAMN04487949_3079 [Halogranum gelatinilyticum]